MDLHTYEYEFEDAVDLCVYKADPLSFTPFIPKLISKMSMLTLLQPVKPLMMRYMAPTSFSRLYDGVDTANDDVCP
ncbi:hypothetical protein TNCT_118011 [Trichonephila clavata]|uniref:Uncharacterized protein n=1 Tax=Trichonephila clavata TaxID=2740835 RepID=A0A8X6ISR1_TRICU|nr:hypothetical protein TNCT_118011 [Trichonephila clavata]